MRGDFLQGRSELVELLRAGGIQLVRCAGKQQFGWHHEAITHNLDVGTIAECGAQLAEEFGAIARQLIDFVGQRQVESRAEVLDFDVFGFDRDIGDVQRLLHLGELFA